MLSICIDLLKIHGVVAESVINLLVLQQTEAGLTLQQSLPSSLFHTILNGLILLLSTHKQCFLPARCTTFKGDVHRRSSLLEEGAMLSHKQVKKDSVNQKVSKFLGRRRHSHQRTSSMHFKRQKIFKYHLKVYDRWFCLLLKYEICKTSHPYVCDRRLLLHRSQSRARWLLIHSISCYHRTSVIQVLPLCSSLIKACKTTDR